MPAPTDSTPARLRQRVAESFDRATMMRHLGIQLVQVRPGEVDLVLPYSEAVSQQQGGFHGGAMGALGDHAAGLAGLSVAPEGMEVVSIEYKVNFLATRQGGALHATGRVVRAGKRIIVTTAEITHEAADGTRTPCALLQQTLTPVPKAY